MKRYFPFAALLAIIFSLTALGDTAVTGDGRVLENPTSNGDLKFRVNIGGVKTDVLSVTGSTGAIAVAKNFSVTNGSVSSATTSSGGGANVFSVNETGASFGELISWGSARGTSSFGSTDANAVQLITEGASNVGLKIGTTTNVPTTLGANNTAAIKINGTGKVELAAREDGTCGIGSLCAGSFTATASNTTNLDSTPTCATSYYMRVGNVVNWGFQCTVDVTSTGVATGFHVTAPQTSANFVGGEAQGTCVTDATTAATTAWKIETVTSAQRLNVVTPNPTSTNSRPISCVTTYKLN